VNVLVVGAGAREHALAWAIARSGPLDELHAAPGNPGIAQLARCHPVMSDDHEGLLALCRRHAISLAVVGPEAPLVAGLADRLRRAGVSVFGPDAAAARIEGSKSFAKSVLEAAGVPTARALGTPRVPCVVKADGLASGKGVFVCREPAELDAALRAARQLGHVVVEELLEGDEVSLFAICDGRSALVLPPARDFKRAFDGDAGANTGGMGAFSPIPELSAAEAEELCQAVHVPVLRELERRGARFVGLLYAGLMLTADGPRVLEFNCRFGDPETQSVVPRLDGDLLELLGSAASGDLAGARLQEAADAAVSVVLAAGEYPERGDTGSPISGVDAAEGIGALVFHAGTSTSGGRLVTSGGRILSVTATATSLGEARDRAYEAARRIRFRGMRLRSDIALQAAAEQLVG
jgi:phosphoribosylamine---glycine ligase